MNIKFLLFNIVVLLAVSVFISPAYAVIDPETVVGMWLFDEGEGEVAAESSGKADDMGLNNGVLWVEGPFGTALGFDGINDTASAAVPDAPQGTSVRTVVAWAKSNNTSLHAGIVAYGNPALNAVFGFMHYGTGIWVSQLWGAAPDVITGVSADTEWHHHAVMYDGKDVIHYIDGEEISAEARTPATAGTTLFLGVEPDLDNWFNGSVDEVAIFNVVLTQDDVKSIMTEGLKMGAAVSSAGKLIATWGLIKD
jgi:concanavalin A-like lectin/glucanase superfamily protein